MILKSANENSISTQCRHMNFLPFTSNFIITILLLKLEFDVHLYDNSVLCLTHFIIIAVYSLDVLNFRCYFSNPFHCVSTSIILIYYCQFNHICHFSTLISFQQYVPQKCKKNWKSWIFVKISWHFDFQSFLMPLFLLVISFFILFFYFFFFSILFFDINTR